MAAKAQALSGISSALDVPVTYGTQEWVSALFQGVAKRYRCRRLLMVRPFAAERLGRLW